MELPELRGRLGEIIHRPGYPQLVLRMGNGPPVRPTPRRPVEQVLL